MVASRSDILLLADFETGDSGNLGYANWGEMADDNWARIEDALGEVTTKALSSSDVTLTDAEERSLYIVLNGTLTANVAVNTNDRKGFWFVSNETTGAFSVTFKTTSGAGITVTQGKKIVAVSDGTDIVNLLGNVAELEGAAFTGDVSVNGVLSATDDILLTSDKREKKDAVAVSDGLSRLLALTGYEYTLKRSGSRQAGLYAQDVQAVLPSAVYEDADGVLHLAYNQLWALAVAAIGEMAATQRHQTQEIARLSAIVEGKVDDASS